MRSLQWRRWAKGHGVIRNDDLPSVTGRQRPAKSARIATPTGFAQKTPRLPHGHEALHQATTTRTIEDPSYCQCMNKYLPPSLHGSENARAVSRLAEYYSADNPYTGVTFDTWKSRHCVPATDEFTADDILAVAFLSVDVPALATKEILLIDARRFNGLLAKIPQDLSFWDAGAPDRESAQWQLETALRGLHQVDLAIASKLMARKRPHLVPINDSVVRKTLGFETSFWTPLFEVFSAASFRNRLRLIRDEADERDDVAMPKGLSLLRVFDVVAWMDGKSAS